MEKVQSLLGKLRSGRKKKVGHVKLCPDLRAGRCAKRGQGRQWTWFGDLGSKKYVAEQLSQHESGFMS